MILIQVCLFVNRVLCINLNDICWVDFLMFGYLHVHMFCCSSWFAYSNLSMHIHVFGSIDVYHNVCELLHRYLALFFVYTSCTNFESLSRCMSISSFPTKRKKPDRGGILPSLKLTASSHLRMEAMPKGNYKMGPPLTTKVEKNPWLYLFTPMVK